ncbi:MAG: vitamin K epoxide reductase family protein [Nitrospirota bacterium]|nr:vitamin K epoxide reductase family protein [Nitrospirota bacterium]
MGKRHKRQTFDSSEGTQSPSPTPPVRWSKTRSPLDIVLLVLAVAGALLTTYLSYVAMFEVHPAFCGEGSGCDLVQSSRWATLFGVPMALWGLVTYVVMTALIWRGRRKSGSWTVFIFVAVCGFAISTYLTVISVVEIEATCPYCLASFAIITTIMVLSIVRRPPEWLTSVKEAVVLALVVVGLLHMHYSGLFSAAAGPENPQLQALAIHLADTGVKFYGAYWCPRCQEQKAQFESSAKRLPYVECSSGGRGSPLTAPCVVENIKNYPTWIIGDQRLTGLQTPSALASTSGFDWQE